MNFQTINTKKPDRTDHVWFKLSQSNNEYKCCLCGAVTRQPPNFPTPRDWVPYMYAKLTQDERDLVPARRSA